MVSRARTRTIGAVLAMSALLFLSYATWNLYSTINAGEAVRQLWHLSDLPNPSKADKVFATYLTSPSKPGTEDSEDNYFIATRMLTYQILHAPETRMRKPIPFVVFVAESVSPKKRARLQRDGATVIELKHLGADWVHPTETRWSDVLTKLRMWEQEQFNLIAFIDADTLLITPPDALFDDPAVRECATTNKPNSPVKGPVEPPSYVMAAITQINKGHDFPPINKPKDLPNPFFFNAGLMVFRPSRALFAYYTYFLAQPAIFDLGLPEQGLLNYVHQELGNMLWTRLDPVWNTQYPSWNDVEHGVRMLHDKWWNTTHGEETEGLFRAWRWRMEGFYEAVDRMG